MDCIVHGVTKSQTRLSNFHFTFLSPGDLADPGIEPSSPALAGGFFTTEPPGKPLFTNRTKDLCTETKSS